MGNAQLQRNYDQLSKQLSTIGYICKGSIMRLYLRCGKPNCQCKTNEKAKHGPYNLWTRKVKGKTVTKYLSDKQAELCKKYIQNANKLEAIVEKMRNLSVEMIESEK